MRKKKMSPNEVSKINKIVELPLSRIIPDPDQPRKFFDQESLEELAESIKIHGLLQPIMVRPSGNGMYVVVHGERRFRAHQLKQLPTIKCIISDMADCKVKDAQVVENLIREDLSDMELAREFQRRMDVGDTHEQIAKAVGKSRTFVTQHLGLLRLPEERQIKLEKGEITFSEARKSQQCYTVTMEEQSSVQVKDLAVYQLISNREIVTTNELLAAMAKDIRLVRGGS
jgi:ParB family chromosome partitioning protein